MVSEFSYTIRSIFYYTVLCLMLLCFGCSKQHLITGDIKVFSIPYRHPGLGVGSGAVQGILILPEGSEDGIVSRGIVMSLQDLEASIIKPDLPVGEWLREKEQWWTDRVPVNSDLISDYNNEYPDMPLPPRKYEIQFSGQYLVERRELVFKISAKLFERALATDWREYNSEAYSGTFFVNQLLQLIQKNIKTIAEENSP